MNKFRQVGTTWIKSDPNYNRGCFIIMQGTPSKPEGYTCLGFQVCQDRTKNYEEWLAKNLSEPARSLWIRVIQIQPPLGSVEAYGRYLDAIAAIKDTGKVCDADLTPQLLGLEGKQIEIVDKYGETRRFIVGKSTGFIPTHLEIANKRSTGGMATYGTPYQSIRVINKRRTNG